MYINIKEFMDDLWKNDPVFKAINLMTKISWVMFFVGIVGVLVIEFLA